MKSYHFDFGDSNDGTMGFSARVTADSPEAAAELLRAALPESISVQPQVTTGPGEIEYINIYTNSKTISTADIFEEDDV